MKIVVEYTVESGHIEDLDGVFIGYHVGLDLEKHSLEAMTQDLIETQADYEALKARQTEGEVEPRYPVPADTLYLMKDHGFSAGEIIQLHEAGLIG